MKRHVVRQNVVRRRLRHLLAAVALLGGARAAAAQSADPRLDTRFDPATRAALAAVVDSARAAGLPVEPLVQQALQGATKRAAGERIVTAVRRLRGDLAGARQALGPRSSAAEVEAGASALHVGAPPAELGRLRAARPERPLTVALGTLADLVAQGVPVDTAVAVTAQLWQRGVSDDELVAVRKEVARDVAAGATPAAAAVVRAQGLGPSNSGRAPRAGGAGAPAGGPGVGASVPRPPRGRGQPGGPKQKPPHP